VEERTELKTGEELFIERYLTNGYNKKDAVEHSGYKTDNPSRYGATILKRPVVQKELKRRIAEKRNEFFIEQHDIQLALWEEANFKGKGSTQSGRIQALIALGKTIEMFSDKKSDDKGSKGISISITNYGDTQAKGVTGQVIDAAKDEARRLETNDESI
jgi:hypothetical protein